MKFSKSFSYALRAILYLAMTEERNTRVHIDEIAIELGVPRYFLAKVMKNLVKAGVIDSLKGPYGGFSINNQTMKVQLFSLMGATGEVTKSGECVLHYKKCNAKKPCPMHAQVESLKSQWQQVLSSTTIGDLVKKDQPALLQSIQGPEKSNLE